MRCRPRRRIGARPMSNEAEFIVYLLHFDEPASGISHYLGITRRDRLAKRMREHARGGGGATTRRLGRHNSQFHLVAVWPVLQRHDERKHKARGHYKTKCPICSPVLTAPVISTHTIELFDPIAEERLLGGFLSMKPKTK
jgi:predicted GIY-YIG superfamily endonuclease